MLGKIEDGKRGWVTEDEMIYFTPFGFILVVVQLLSPVQLFATPWTAAHQTSLSLIISWSLPKFMSIKSLICLDYLVKDYCEAFYHSLKSNHPRQFYC